MVPLDSPREAGETKRRGGTVDSAPAIGITISVSFRRNILDRGCLERILHGIIQLRVCAGRHCRSSERAAAVQRGGILQPGTRDKCFCFIKQLIQGVVRKKLYATPYDFVTRTVRALYDIA